MARQPCHNVMRHSDCYLVRVRVVTMVVMGMVVAVMMIARLVMLNVVKHLYQVNIPPLSTD